MLNRVRIVAAMLPLALTLGGCLFEAKIDDKGGAEMKMHYRVAPNTTIDKAVKDLESSDVKVVSKSIDKDGWVDATVQTADVTKLPTALYFKAWAITLVDGKDQGTKKLTARYTNKAPGVKIPQSGLDYYGDEIKFVVTVPGEIVTSNATETKGNTGTWTFKSQKFLADKDTALEVTYKLPAKP